MTNAVNLASAAGTGFSFRNRIINGDIRIDQRNGGGAISASGWSADRWYIERGAGNTASFSATQSTDVPSGHGFTNSLAINFTSTDTAEASNDFFVISQFIEGNNIADLAWGSASAKTVTVSFWVKAPVAGTYSCTLYNSGASRINPQGFTVNSANTWEYKTVSYAGDTTGTWLTNNGRGIIFNIYIKMWSGNQGAAGWNASSIYGVTQVNGNSATGVFAITGVQLEVGSVATPFERRPYGLELSLCQRYYQAQSSLEYHMCPAPGATYASTYGVHFPVHMRTTPSLGFSYATSNAIGSYTSAIYSSPRHFVHFISASVSTNAYMSFTYTASAEL
jgi:hypothetical protein